MKPKSANLNKIVTDEEVSEIAKKPIEQTQTQGTGRRKAETSSQILKRLVNDPKTAVIYKALAKNGKQKVVGEKP